VYGGQLVLPADDVPGTLRCWRDWASDIGEGTATSLAVVPFPDAPAVPAPLRGRTAVAVRLAHTGDGGERMADELRALGTPLLADLGELAWTDSARIHRDPPGPAPSVGTTVGLATLTDAVLDAAVDTLAGAPVRRVVELRRLGGALGRPSGLPIRSGLEWQAGTVSIVPGEGDAEVATALDARFRAAVDGLGRVPNFLFGEGADPAAVRDAYPEADWARLRAVKAAEDPDDVIAAAAPIPPAPARGAGPAARA